MNNPLLRRVLRRAGVPELADILGDRLSRSDLQSLLLEVFRRQAARIAPSDVVRQYTADRFVAPSGVPAAELLAFDKLAMDLLPEGFEALDLSPVLPLGGHSALAPVHQDRVLSTARGTEVAADATVALALECASRRRDHLAERPRSGTPVRLAASQRQLRCQAFGGPATVAHFRLLALCTAGHTAAGRHFETTAMVEHLGYHLDLLHACRSLGLHPGHLRVVIEALEPRYLPPLQALLLDALARRYPDATLELGLMQDGPRGYYRFARAMIYATTPGGQELHLVDCGITDWTQRLLSSRKERLCTSGIGSERLCMAYRS